MSDIEPGHRDAFFAAFKVMEQQSSNCVTKGKFLDNVLTAKEQITFAVVDRCREALLQLRQCHYVVKVHHNEFKTSPLGHENITRLDELLNLASQANEEATAALDEILSWVPQAVNTRSIGAVP